MKTKTFLLSIFLALPVIGAMAQSSQQARDTLAFRRFLSQGTMADHIKASTLASIYYGLEHNEIPSHTGRNYDFGWPDSYYENYTYITYRTRPSRFVQYDDREFSRTRMEDETWNEGNGDSRSALSNLRQQVRSYQNSYTDKKQEKQALVQALTAFNDKSERKPFFFADINNNFNGSISKYVDYLYRKSFLTSNRRLKRFVYYANIVDFRADPGVRFVMGVALYELWVRDVREGRVIEYTSPQQ